MFETMNRFFAWSSCDFRLTNTKLSRIHAKLWHLNSPRSSVPHMKVHLPPSRAWAGALHKRRRIHERRKKMFCYSEKLTCLFNWNFIPTNWSRSVNIPRFFPCGYLSHIHWSSSNVRLRINTQNYFKIENQWMSPQLFLVTEVLLKSGSKDYDK